MKGINLLILTISILFSSQTVLPSLSGVRPAWASGSVVDKNHASCLACHRMPESEITPANAFPEGIDPSSICLDCHHYRDNHHPVNFIPETGFPSAAEGTFPLFKREIRCLTCHKVHGTQGEIAGSKLLRGGPYTFRTEICFLCHDRDLNTKINPHRMINDRGEIRRVNGRPVCLMCHASVPDQTVEPPGMTFKADVAFLCWRCHPPMLNDGFFKGHFLVKPKEKTLEYMQRVQAEKRVSLPLQPRDRITCSTCHNPHQKGAISSESARAGEDAPHRLRMPSGSVCSGCHDM
jgi:hypothetical protein